MLSKDLSQFMASLTTYDSSSAYAFEANPSAQRKAPDVGPEPRSRGAGEVQPIGPQYDMADVLI